jgi:hypothetical protein
MFHFMNGDINLPTDNLKVVLLSATYTPSTITGGDEFLSVIPGGAIIATSPNLSSKVINSPQGSFQAANPVFSSVVGATVTQFALYNDTGSSATSQLLILWDNATNLPVVPNGGNITVQWAGSPNYVFSFNFERLSDEERSIVERIFDALRGLFKGGSDLLIPVPSLTLG